MLYVRDEGIGRIVSGMLGGVFYIVLRVSVFFIPRLLRRQTLGNEAFSLSLGSQVPTSVILL